MRIIEVISEAIGTTPPVGTTSVSSATDGVPKVGTPASQPVPGQQPPQQTTPAAQPTLGNQQPMGQDPAMKQGMQATMTDIDTIAKQIDMLKQKQQQMQQQMQKPVQ